MYDFGGTEVWRDEGTEVRGCGGTRSDSAQKIGRANYSRTPVPSYPRTPEESTPARKNTIKFGFLLAYSYLCT